MFKEKFEMVLQKDEEIKWSGKVKLSAFVLRNYFKLFLWSLIPHFAIANILYAVVVLILYKVNIIPKSGELYVFAYLIFTIITNLAYIFYLILDGRNTFFCITNKRIIKRNGAFNNKFVHYTLKNVGTVEVNGGLFDSKKSATLLVTTKDFHTDSRGNTRADRLKVNSLDNAYEAYNTLSEVAEGNNEALRIKIEE